MLDTKGVILETDIGCLYKGYDVYDTLEKALDEFKVTKTDTNYEVFVHPFGYKAFTLSYGLDWGEEPYASKFRREIAKDVRQRLLKGGISYRFYT